MKAGTRHRSWMHFLPSSKFPLSKSDQRRKNIKFETIFSTSSDNDASSTVRTALHLAATLILISAVGAADCPEECVCMWKNGKETTECINRDKDSIPQGIEPSTQVLDLRGNNIRVLSNNMFLDYGITNLQRFYCSYCKVGEVEPSAFNRLTNLIELDLSENTMREIPSESWKHTKALMRLNLSGNPIKLIRSGAFQRLKFVTNIALSHCDIETVEKGAFDGMSSLLEVKLDRNKLQHLPAEGLFASSLHHVELHDNPFRCDCRLVEFAHWLQNSGIPRSVEPTCYSPKRLAGKQIINVSISNLACLPQVESAATLYGDTSSDTLLTLVQDDLLTSDLETAKGEDREKEEGNQHKKDSLSLPKKDGVFTIPASSSFPYSSPKESSSSKSTTSTTVGAAVVGSNVSLRCSVFGLPSAFVSWWQASPRQRSSKLDPNSKGDGQDEKQKSHKEVTKEAKSSSDKLEVQLKHQRTLIDEDTLIPRLVANGTKLVHSWEDQYYVVNEYRANAHQLISEFVILSIRPEDEGVFFCSAENPAGIATANFTVKVIDDGESLILSAQDKNQPGVSSNNVIEVIEEKEESNMFKVEYILGFGAAAVIVLTIIIVLILYLILQCRGQQRKRRAARRRAAGLCDTSSGGGAGDSYLERSTVDFIVPGEMELTSAVRSVSYKSDMNKCNGNVGKSNDPEGLAGNAKPNKLLRGDGDQDGNDVGSGNDGDDEEEYTGSHGTTKIPLRSSSLKSANAQPLVNLSDMYLRQNGFLPPIGWHQGMSYGPRMMGQPPQYRPPPPVFDGEHKVSDKNQMLQQMPHMRCFCCGEMQHWGAPIPNHSQFFTATPGGVPYSSHAPPGSINPGYPGTMFIKASNATGSSSVLPVHMPTSTSMIRPDFFADFNPQQHLPTVPNTLPPHARGSVGLGLMRPNGKVPTACLANRHLLQMQQNLQVDPSMQSVDWSVNPMHSMLPHRMPYPGTLPYHNSGLIQHKDSNESEEVRYGPFSDGEGDRITRKPQKGRSRRPSFPMSTSIIDGIHPQHFAGIVPPHYVTLSRATTEALAAGASFKNDQIQKGIFERIQFENSQFGPELFGPQFPSAMGNKQGKRYTSQPQLNEKNGVAFNLAEDKSPPSQLGRSSSCGASSNKGRFTDQKPEIPKYKPILQVKSYKGVTSTTAVPLNVIKKESGDCSEDDYLFPDLPPPPDALLEPRKNVRGISPAISKKDYKKGTGHAPSFLVHQTSFDFASSDSQMMNDGTQNSRSSSLDDLTLQECPPILSQESGRDDAEIRNCIRESYYQKSNTLPINGSLVNGSKRVSPSLQLYGSEEKQLSQNAVEAESLPLIRPLGSAPELQVKNYNNPSFGPGIIRMPIRPALRQTPQQNFSAPLYGMMRMPQPHLAQPQSKRKKSFKSSLNTSNSLGGSGGGSNKRVMFSGVSDNESASESQDDSTQNAHSNTLPILKPPPMKPTPILSKQPIVIRKPPRQDPEPKDDIWVLRSDVESKTSNHTTVSSNSSTNISQSDVINRSMGAKVNQSVSNDNIPITGVVIAQPQPYIFSTPMSVVSASPSAKLGQLGMTNNHLEKTIGNHILKNVKPIGLNPANFPVSQSHLISPSSINPSGQFQHASSASTIQNSYSQAGPPTGKLPPEPRPPPPPPPPRLTPVVYSSSSKSTPSSKPSSSLSSSSMSNNTSSGSSNASSSNTSGANQPRAENPAVAQNRLQAGNQGPAFHESPDEGYHEDEGGSETM